MENNLTINEKNELGILEGIIGREMKSFMAVGNALFTIQGQKLYREKFKTFKDYCRDRWGMGRQTAYQLIAAAGVVENVRDCGQIPTCEYQTRPLVPLEPEQQREAWEEAVKKAVETAPEGKITYKHVKDAVTELTGPAPPVPPKPKDPHPESDAHAFVSMAMATLERIRDDDPRREEALNKLLNWINEKLKEPMVKKSS